MSKSLKETEKRLKLAGEFNSKMKDSAVGIVMIGSVAYAPGHSVTSDSDLDLIVVYEDINTCIDMYFSEEAEKKHLRKNAYDGFLVKRKIGGGCSSPLSRQISVSFFLDMIDFHEM